MPIPEAVEAPRSTARWAASLPSPALACVLFGGTALVILCDWFGVGDRGFVDFAGAVYDAVVLAAGVACLLRARAVASERAGWTLMGLAILSWGAGEVYWTLFIGNDPTS